MADPKGSSKPDFDNIGGFETPFQDALIQKIPTSGTPTGSLPKP